MQLIEEILSRLGDGNDSNLEAINGVVDLLNIYAILNVEYRLLARYARRILEQTYDSEVELKLTADTGIFTQSQKARVNDLIQQFDEIIWDESLDNGVRAAASLAHTHLTDDLEFRTFYDVATYLEYLRDTRIFRTDVSPVFVKALRILGGYKGQLVEEAGVQRLTNRKSISSSIHEMSSSDLNQASLSLRDVANEVSSSNLRDIFSPKIIHGKLSPPDSIKARLIGVQLAELVLSKSIKDENLKDALNVLQAEVDRFLQNARYETGSLDALAEYLLKQSKDGWVWLKNDRYKKVVHEVYMILSIYDGPSKDSLGQKKLNVMDKRKIKILKGELRRIEVGLSQSVLDVRTSDDTKKFINFARALLKEAKIMGNLDDAIRKFHPRLLKNDMDPVSELVIDSWRILVGITESFRDNYTFESIFTIGVSNLLQLRAAEVLVDGVKRNSALDKLMSELVEALDYPNKSDAVEAIAGFVDSSRSDDVGYAHLVDNVDNMRRGFYAESLMSKRVVEGWPEAANDDNYGASSSSIAPGGIDFNSELLDLQIKRDGKGVPLPVAEQPLEMMNIQGFVPVIINITPVSMPLLLGITNDGIKDPIEVSFNRDRDPLARHIDCIPT